MLKFLFKALLQDGTIIEQDQTDTSKTTPNKNAFYDVLSNIDKVRAFAFYDVCSGDEYLVDLADGHFEINQKPFFMHNIDDSITNRRLIYYKTNVVNVVGGQVASQKTYSYTFGWQGNLPDGKNVKYVMTLT